METAASKEMIVDYLTDRISAKFSELSELIGLKAVRTSLLLSQMTEEGILVTEGEGRNRTYKLKS